MAKDDERPQFNPRHRIAGAIILVSLAVIFIPMLLDESAPPAENQSLTQIPSRDSVAAETKVVVTPVTPAGEAPDKTPITVADAQPEKPTAGTPTPPAPLTTETAAAPTPDRPSTPVAANDDATKKTTVATAKPVAAKPSDIEEKISKGWMVQVGTFANADNADRLRDKLKNLGYTVRAENITVQGNKATRLRVGPYRDKSDAASAQTRLQKELNIKGLVLAYP